MGPVLSVALKAVCLAVCYARAERSTRTPNSVFLHRRMRQIARGQTPEFYGPAGDNCSLLYQAYIKDVAVYPMLRTYNCKTWNISLEI